MRGDGSVRRSYSALPEHYKLLEEVGHGASATVYRAIYLPNDEIVAVKRLDLDRCNSNLDDIRREAQTMSLIDHPNVIKAFCSFVVENFLWVVMPFMNEGSCLHLLKSAYPEGFEEPIICSILKETLKALEYLHRHGHIHRDVKAGNILVDSSGVVKLGDFGVSACMFDKGDRQRTRNTFVGTPCWMAPEVLQPGSGYDFKADMWSFGITAMELAHGHAPFSKNSPMKVLLMTLQNAPPGLDYERDKKFSMAFKEMIGICLVKDQNKRPTAEKLLKHPFFKRAKPPRVVLKSILTDSTPLWNRVKELQLKDAAQLALKKMPSSEQEAISQSEYQRGVSAWNFDIEDLKAQASLMQDDDDIFEMQEDEEYMRTFTISKDPSTVRPNSTKTTFSDKIKTGESNSVRELPGANCSAARDEILQTYFMDSSIQEKVNECDGNNLKNDLAPSPSSHDTEPNNWRAEVGTKQQAHGSQIVNSGAHFTSLSERGQTSERTGSSSQQGDTYKRDTWKVSNLSGPLMLPNRASANSLSAPTRSSTCCGDPMEDKTKPSMVQIKGRFSVTSENVDLGKDSSPCNISRRPSQPGQHPKEVGNSNPKEVGNNTLPASSLMPHLQSLFQQTSHQKDLIMNILNSLQKNEIIDGFQSGAPSQAQNLRNEKLADPATSKRERFLLTEISELEARMINLADELTAVKIKHTQLQQDLRAFYCQKDGEEDRRNEI